MTQMQCTRDASPHVAGVGDEVVVTMDHHDVHNVCGVMVVVVDIKGWGGVMVTVEDGIITQIKKIVTPLMTVTSNRVLMWF